MKVSDKLANKIKKMIHDRSSILRMMAQAEQHTADHRELGDVDLINRRNMCQVCATLGIEKRASYGPEEGGRLRCFEHREPGDVRRR